MRNTLWTCLVVALVAGLSLTQGFSQETRREGRGRFDPEQMRQAYLDRMKETLGATDEEWTALAPRIEKVQGLSTQLGSSGRGAFGGRRTGGRAEGQRTEGDQPERQLSEVEKAATALRETLDNQDATAQEIAKKLADLREAREKVKQELAAAQDELREILTARQEAQLVLMGLLD